MGYQFLVIKTGLLIIDYSEQPIVVCSLFGNLSKGSSSVIGYRERLIVICSLVAT